MLAATSNLKINESRCSTTGPRVPLHGFILYQDDASNHGSAKLVAPDRLVQQEESIGSKASLRIADHAPALVKSDFAVRGSLLSGRFNEIFLPV